MEGFRLDVIIEALPDLWRGALSTIALSGTGFLLATLLGFVVALGRLSPVGPLRVLARGYVDLIRGTPALVQIFFIFFALPALGVRLDRVLAGVVALGLNSGAYLSEIFRAGIESVDPGQQEAARALGMSRRRTLWEVVLPQAGLRVIPPSLGEFTMLVQGTSLLSVIAISELTRVGQRISGLKFRPLEAYLAVGAVYLLINMLLAQGSSRLESTLKRRQGLV